MSQDKKAKLTKEEKKALRAEKKQNRRHLTKKQKKLIPAGIALLLLIVAACYTVFIAPLLDREQWIYKEETVTRGTLRVGVTESGSLEYVTKSIDYSLNLDISDDDDDDGEDEDEVQKYLKIEELYAVSGQRVSSGDALVKLTEDSVADVRSLLKSAVVEAQSDYAEAESTYELSVLEAETTYDTQKIAAAYASSIKASETSANTNEIISLQVQLEQKKANTASLTEKVEDATKDYNEALEAYEEAKEGYDAVGTDHVGNFTVYETAYLNARSKYQQAKSALSEATQALEENAEEITSLEQQLTTAQAKQKLVQLQTNEEYQETVITGENAQTTYNATVEGLKETLQEALETKEECEEQLEAFEAFVGDDGILYATEDGIITSTSYEAGDRLEVTGAILTYATAQDLRISVDVTQEDIVDLSVGDMVDITFTAYPEETYTGSIASINTTATSDYSNTVSYTVEIAVDGSLDKLYAGMTADVVFVTEEKEDVLYVSRKAIVEKDGKTYVYVDNGLGGKELEEVETGTTNGVDIEILSGLEEGETIYLASKVSSTSEVTETGESEDGSTDDNTGSMDTDAFDFSDFDGSDMPSGGDFGGGDFGGDFSGDFGGGVDFGGGGQGMPGGGGPGN